LARPQTAASSDAGSSESSVPCVLLWCCLQLHQMLQVLLLLCQHCVQNALHCFLRLLLLRLRLLLLQSLLKAS
jgi:hypothetical protein